MAASPSTTIDFGESNAFDHDGAIMGSADRPITVTTRHPGRYTYSVGASTAGSIYGMCDQADTQRGQRARNPQNGEGCKSQLLPKFKLKTPA